jgi:predicted acyl esterase
MIDARSEVRDGMRIDWDMPIAMDDGLILRADVFRPVLGGRYPVLLSYGPYGKGLAFQDGYPTAWEFMVSQHPDTAAGSTNKYQNWEVVDPEKWVPDGYVCIRVDSRGAGRSPGQLALQSLRETRDLYLCIEWAATQPWSSGKVGLNGISYYASNQWSVAALQPPHLAAICVWEGFSDQYREAAHHGGIPCLFAANWFEMQVKNVQHGFGARGARSRVTGELVCGPDTLTEEQLTQNRLDPRQGILDHPNYDETYRRRAVDWSKVTVPLLSAANWGGQGLHTRGNLEGFTRAASPQKWLEVHGGSHWAAFYTDYGVTLQKRFFDHFLKGAKTDWENQPRVQLQIRHPGEKFVKRHESEWPLARTQWTKFFLNPADRSLGTQPPEAETSIDFEALGDGVTFLTTPLRTEMEITGPSAARLFVSSTTRDADLFLVLRVFDPTGLEVVFQGALDPHTPVGQGWLRASHRRLDPALTTFYSPYHSHDVDQPLQAGETATLDIEIWPTCIVVPPGYRIGLTIRGKDYEWEGAAATLSNIKNPMKGCGPFVHDDPAARPPEIYGGRTTLHFGGTRQPHILLPIIPASPVNRRHQ